MFLIEAIELSLNCTLHFQGIVKEYIYLSTFKIMAERAPFFFSLNDFLFIVSEHTTFIILQCLVTLK